MGFKKIQLTEFEIKAKGAQFHISLWKYIQKQFIAKIDQANK